MGRNGQWRGAHTQVRGSLHYKFLGSKRESEASSAAVAEGIEKDAAGDGFLARQPARQYNRENCGSTAGTA